MATIEEKTKSLKELYAAARAPADYIGMIFLRQELEKDMIAEKKTTGEIAAAILPGFWGEYHVNKKFGCNKRQTERLLVRLKQVYLLMKEKKEIELVINYGYLLSCAYGQLMDDQEESLKIIQEISKMAKESDNVSLVLKAINAEGLVAMKMKEWQEAIWIFDSGQIIFPEAKNIPDAKQHLANIINNRGLAKINNDDRKLIPQAVKDLREALDLYMEIKPPPLKHIEGIQKRLIVATTKIVFDKNIYELFAAGRKEEAERIIFSLKGADLSGEELVSLGIIREGLQIADNFLKLSH